MSVDLFVAFLNQMYVLLFPVQLNSIKFFDPSEHVIPAKSGIMVIASIYLSEKQNTLRITSVNDAVRRTLLWKPDSGRRRGKMRGRWKVCWLEILSKMPWSSITTGLRKGELVTASCMISSLLVVAIQAAAVLEWCLQLGVWFCNILRNIQLISNMKKRKLRLTRFLLL